MSRRSPSLCCSASLPSSSHCRQGAFLPLPLAPVAPADRDLAPPASPQVLLLPLNTQVEPGTPVLRSQGDG